MIIGYVWLMLVFAASLLALVLSVFEIFGNI